MILILALLLSAAVVSCQGAKPSEKKGLCIPPGENFHCGDFEAFPRVSWWYNWHTQPNHEVDGHCTCAGDCGPAPETPAFVPMIWGYHEDNPWHDDESDPVAEKYPIILGFNEPNHSDQSDISPETAAAAWIEIQEMYPDRLLVSPAPAGGNTNWFDPFFQACEELGCRIDYLATHDYEGKANHVMNRLEMLYNRYGKKIWLTEFAKCCTRDLKEVEDFAKEIIPRLEEAEYVFRYSWFITRYNARRNHWGRMGSSNITGFNDSQFNAEGSDWYLDKVNALFEEDSDELSSVGRIYNNL